MTESNLVTNYKPRAIGTPIARNGDKNTITDTSTDTGVVNIDKGFPSKFSAPRAEGGKSVSRKDMNGMFNLLSQPEYFQQYMGRTLWDSGVAATGYPKGAKVWYYDASGNSAEYVSKTDSNTGTPGTSSNWVKTGTANGIEIDPSSISGVLSSYVSLSGSQTITGAKSFSTSPTVPTVTVAAANDSKAANVGMLRSSIGGCVSTSGDQTVAGTKTFSSSPKVPTIAVDSLSASGTRSVNEQTLLAAIGSGSSGGMFIDTTVDPVKISTDNTNPTHITKASVIYIILGHTDPYSNGAATLHFSATSSVTYNSPVLTCIHISIGSGFQMNGSLGPFYVKSGYFWLDPITYSSTEQGPYAWVFTCL